MVGDTQHGTMQDHDTPTWSWYTGIGSRSTPPHVLAWMHQIGVHAASHRFRLRTGGASGADFAFLSGACQNPRPVRLPPAQVYLPWSGFNQVVLRTNPGAALARYSITQDALTSIVARTHHPAWERLSAAARKLHQRNVHQVLGDPSEPEPSICVLCWTHDGAGMNDVPVTETTGGTGQAIRVALHYGIPVINLQTVRAESDPIVVADHIVSILAEFRRARQIAPPSTRLYWDAEDSVPF